MYADIRTVTKNGETYAKYEAHLFPKKIAHHLLESLSVPDHVDFYPEMSKIEKISLEILENRSFNLDSDFSTRAGNCDYPGKASYVKIKTIDQKFKIALHLFPWARLNKKEIPSKMDLYIKNNMGIKKNVELPQEMLKNFLKLLNDGRPNEKFTCIEFMNWMNGIYIDNLDKLCTLLDGYAFSTFFNIEDLVVGDSIIFLRRSAFVHAALYLGKGLYIYHLGNCYVRIGTLDNILKIYPSNKIEKLHLKKRIVVENDDEKILHYDSTKFLKLYSCHFKKRAMVPNEIDFYPEITKTITKINLRIYTDRFFYFLGYRTQFSNIELETRDQEKYEIGLHLFPVLRLKKKIEAKINLFLMDKEGNSTLLDFPDRISQRLLRLINQGKPHSGFFNFQFVNYLKNKYTIKAPSNTKCFHPSRIEKFSKCSVNKLQPGNLVALFKRVNGPPIHAAIYLQHELFIWQMSCKGICISTLEDMFNHYPEAIKIKKMIILSRR